MARDVTTDSHIRQALHSKRLRQLKGHPNTIVVDELGLAHAKSRIDVAVINGCIHGYEIKSASDNLERLDGQVETYSQTLQKLTFVVAPKHLDEILKRVPDWCGVTAALQGVRRGISFNVIRRAKPNPVVDPVMMAHLLWRSEVVDLLVALGHPAKSLRGPRIELYRMLCRNLKPKEIAASIRISMTKRLDWRDHLPRV